MNQVPIVPHCPTGLVGFSGKCHSELMRIVQFSDPHLLPARGETFLGVDTFLSLQKAVQLTQSLNPLPDAIFVTGDIAERGDAKTYQRFRDVLAAQPLPVFVVPGNHDNEEAMAEVFAGSHISFPRHAVLKDCLCLFLNSQVKEKSHGFLSMSTLQEVKELLKGHTTNAVLVSLHHPISSPCPALGCQLENETEFLAVLAESARPVTVLSGHLHREVDVTKGQMHFLTSPSTFAQCIHPTAEQQLDLNDFWASHKMDTTQHGFRILDRLPSGEFETSIHWY